MPITDGTRMVTTSLASRLGMSTCQGRGKQALRACVCVCVCVCVWGGRGRAGPCPPHRLMRMGGCRQCGRSPAASQPEHAGAARRTHALAGALQALQLAGRPFTARTQRRGARSGSARSGPRAGRTCTSRSEPLKRALSQMGMVKMPSRLLATARRREARRARCNRGRGDTLPRVGPPSLMTPQYSLPA